MRSNRKGLTPLVVPEVTIIKLLGVFLITIFFAEKISTLFKST